MNSLFVDIIVLSFPIQGIPLVLLFGLDRDCVIDPNSLIKIHRQPLEKCLATPHCLFNPYHPFRIDKYNPYDQSINAQPTSPTSVLQLETLTRMAHGRCSFYRLSTSGLSLQLFDPKDCEMDATFRRYPSHSAEGFSRLEGQL